MTSESNHIDFKGWRFFAPFRCMSCAREISIEQFAFARLCGSCDRPLPGPRCYYTGPRKMIDPNTTNFIPAETWSNPESGVTEEVATQRMMELKRVIDAANKRQREMIRRDCRGTHHA